MLHTDIFEAPITTPFAQEVMPSEALKFVESPSNVSEEIPSLVSEEMPERNADHCQLKATKDDQFNNDSGWVFFL